MLKNLKRNSFLLRKQGSLSPVASIQTNAEPNTSPRDEHDFSSQQLGPNDANGPDQQSQIRQLETTQRRTLEVLSALNTAIKELRDAVNNNKDWTGATDLGSFGGGGALLPSTDAESDIERESDLDEHFDRKQVRLDGLEVYAVVSAVTAGTLVAVFDSYHPGDIVDLFYDGRYLEVLMSALFLVTGTVGIVCGLHCIFVFFADYYVRTHCSGHGKRRCPRSLFRWHWLTEVPWLQNVRRFSLCADVRARCCDYIKDIQQPMGTSCSSCGNHSSHVLRI